MSRSFQTGSALLLSAGRAASLLGFILATALLSRALPAAEYGTFRQCWTLYLIAVPIASAGFAQSLFYFVPLRGGSGHWPLVRRTFAVAAGIGGVVALALGAGSGLIAEALQNRAGELAFAIFGLFLAASIPMQLSDAAFMSIGRPGLAALFNVLNRTTVLVGLALPVAVLRLRLTSSFAILSVVQVAALAALWVLSRRAHLRRAGETPMPMKVLIPEQLRFAAPVMASSMFGAVFVQMDKLIVGAFVPPSEFAVYSNGAFDNPIVSLIVIAWSATAATELVRFRTDGNARGYVDLWSSMTERVALALIPMGAFLFAFAPEAVIVLFSAKYADSSSVFRLYTLLTPVRMIAFSTVFTSLNRNVTYLVGHVGACALVGVTSLLLFRVMGSLGPAVALVATSYILAGVFLFSVSKDLGVGVSDVLPYRQITRVSVASAAAAWAARWATVGLVPGRGFTTLVAGAAAFAAFVLAALFTAGALRPAALAGSVTKRLSTRT